MELQTKIPLNAAVNQIDYESRLLLLGSCFVENMGQKLEYFKFQMQQNPFGILFHPLAIEKIISKSVNKEKYTEDDIFFLNERWHCFDVHSDLSDVSNQALLQKLNEGLQNTRQEIIKSTHIIITLGTAWVYQKSMNQKVVANCHKVPQKEFTKRLLSITEITHSLENMVKMLQTINKNAQFIFTISPVRHLKDGFIENQRSKALLITAVHELLGVSPLGSRGIYFPSYELMMDELRDYRFYERDMVHPNQLGIDYIWEKFKLVWISPKALPIMEEVNAVQKALAHRPVSPSSVEHQVFQKSLADKITYLKKVHPFMGFDN